MKRLTAILLCMVLVLGTLSGCGKKDRTDESGVSDLSGPVFPGDVEDSSVSDADIPTSDGDTSGNGSQTDGKNSKPNGNTTSGTTTAGKNNGALPVKDMKGRTFTFAAPSWDVVDTSAAWVKKLEQTYNCHFANRQLGSDYSTLYTSIISKSPLADVVVFNYSNFYAAVKRGFMRDLSSSAYIDPKDTSLYIPAMQEKLTTINGKVYGLIDTYAFRRVLVYNRQLINGADDLQTLSNAGQLTWDKLYQILQKVVKGGKSGIAGKMYESDVLQTFVLANSGQFYTRDGLKFTYTLDSKNTRDALTYVQSLQQAGLIMPMDGGNYLYPQTQFVKGRVAVMIADGWNLDYVASKAKFDYGIVLVPSKDDPKNGLIDLSEFETRCIPSSVSAPEDVELILAAYMQAAKAAEENEKKVSFDGKYNNLANDGDRAVLKAYAAAIDAGRGVVDYRSALADFYNDGINVIEKHCLYGEITVQSYLESVGSIYKAKADSFNS